MGKTRFARKISNMIKDSIRFPSLSSPCLYFISYPLSPLTISTTFYDSAFYLSAPLFSLSHSLPSISINPFLFLILCVVRFMFWTYLCMRISATFLVSRPLSRRSLSYIILRLYHYIAICLPVSFSTSHLSVYLSLCRSLCLSVSHLSLFTPPPPSSHQSTSHHLLRYEMKALLYLYDKHIMMKQYQRCIYFAISLECSVNSNI